MTQTARSIFAWLAVAIVGLTDDAAAQSPGRLEFTRMTAHWDDYSDAGYLPFIEDAQPEIVQVGFYGAHFWSLAHTAFGSGYPAHFPERGLSECGRWFEDLNAQVHRRGSKVVGHFNVEFLVGDPDSPEGPRGFFKFYRDLWDERELGPRPTADPVELLQKDREGKPIVHDTYKIGGMREYWGCLNNPGWRAVLKAWLKAGIRRGVNGFIANYFYRHNCLCRHCVAGFKRHLAERFTAEQLRERFGVRDLDHHEFPEIVGWHDPKESTPLRREMLRFSQIATKRAFDEVFIEFGRSLNPDLIVAQWDHLGDMDPIRGDERCLLPAELWGKGEDYLWYSTGDAAYFTDLAKGLLGEATLQARYIRGAFDDKPYTLGKYESTRIRVAIAELAANGGAPMGFYARFRDPAARRELVRYYGFLRRNDALYRANRPHSEVVLLYPRRRVHEGDVASVAQFKRIGRLLLDRHVLFDILPDDIATQEKLGRYSAVVNVSDTVPASRDLTGVGFSRFEAPPTVRVSASRPEAGGELTVHFVNYDRTEPPEKRMRRLGYRRRAAPDGLRHPGGSSRVAGHARDACPVPLARIRRASRDPLRGGTGACSLRGPGLPGLWGGSCPIITGAPVSFVGESAECAFDRILQWLKLASRSEGHSMPTVLRTILCRIDACPGSHLIEGSKWLERSVDAACVHDERVQRFRNQVARRFRVKISGAWITAMLDESLRPFLDHMTELARLGTARLGRAYLTEKLAYASRFAWCRLAPTLEFNDRNRKSGAAELLAKPWGVYGSSRFRAAVESARLRGLTFGPESFDPMRGDPRAWYACLPSALAGRGLDHPWAPLYEPEVVEGKGRIGADSARNDTATRERLAPEVAELCELFPLGEVFLKSFPRLWAGSLPATDFAGLVDITGASQWHTGSVAIRRPAIDALLAAGMLGTDLLEPIDVVETREDAGVPILDEEVGPLPDSFVRAVTVRRSVAIANDAPESNEPARQRPVLIVSPSRVAEERVGVDEIESAAARMGVSTPRVWSRFLSEIGLVDLADLSPYRPSAWADDQPDHEDLRSGDESLPSRMLAVGSALNGDWYSLDLDHVTEDGDCPLLKFDHETSQCVDSWPSVAEFINDRLDESSGT